MADTIKIEGWLPIFPGFYETLFAFDWDRACEKEEMNYTLFNSYAECPENLEKINPDIMAFIEEYYTDWFDNEQYEEDVAKSCVEYINDKLKETEPLCPQFTFIYEKIDSPREYNFSNDCINCQLEYEMSEFEGLVDYIHKNYDDFAKHIEETFTSRSGFMSFHSSEAQNWLDEFDNFIDNQEISKSLVFKISYVIEWYLFHSTKDLEYRVYGENEYEMEMYERLSDINIYPSNYFQDSKAVDEINKNFSIKIERLVDLITDNEELEPLIKIKDSNQLELFD